MLTEGERVEHIDAAPGKIWFSGVGQSNFDEVGIDTGTKFSLFLCLEAA